MTPNGKKRNAKLKINVPKANKNVTSVPWATTLSGWVSIPVKSVIISMKRVSPQHNGQLTRDFGENEQNE
jgi:hypothetical protein